VDAYGAEEQLTGLYTMIEDGLAVPFETEVLGVTVTVERVEMTDAGQLVAVCRRGSVEQAIGLLELPLPTLSPDGAEWIAAYRRWAR
jgi:hypothetical protein